MAESVVALALETLRDLLLEETRFLLGVSGEVKGLESQLKEMVCLLKDADKRQHDSDSVANWIAKIRDLAYRAEDVLETYAAQFSSIRKGGFLKLLRRFSCILKQGVALHQIGSEISVIKLEFERVSKSMQDYGIRRIIQGEDSIGNKRWKRQTFPFEIEEDCFVGMESDLKRLVSLVIEDGEHRVISIWGMGGKGKTTIARKVYNHMEVKRCFECFAWICVTQQCQISSVLEEVLEQLVPRKAEENTRNLSNTELIHQLCQVQRDKRCFIVLDDLWEMDHWEGIKHAFCVTGLNSKILLTTRKKDIADVGFAHDLGLLNGDDGWTLLKRKASPQNVVTDFAREETLFERIGKEMVRKCGYLPLGVSLLGGILSKKKSIKEWMLVSENMNAHLYMRGEDIGKDNLIHGVLDLSYADLPSYLKPCFLLMGYFREDQPITANQLYMMWIAQGMISKESLGKEDSLMDVAELYLGELASRCVVQVVPEDDAIVGKKYRMCQLHDTVRELCLLKGRKDDFRLNTIDHRNGNFGTMDPSSSDVKTRHLVFNFLGESEEKLQPEFASFWKEMNKNNHIRSLQFLVQYSPGRIVELPLDFLDFERLKLLRTLVFECFKFEGRKLPREIGNLIHLRYLRLYRCELDELPPSICHLKYLYALDINGCQKTRIPNVLFKMHRLRHLILPFFPDVKGKAHRLDGLDELETLSGFSSLLHDFQSISKMKNLRELHVLVYDNKSLSEIIDGVNTNWKNLRKSFIWIMDGCELSAADDDKILSILNKIFTCSNLHYLRIYVPIKKLKVEQIEMELIFPSLVYLNLMNTVIEDDPMETLGKLPFLRWLSLRKRSFVGKGMTCGAAGFPKLKILELIRLQNLRAWRVEAGAMPCVTEIVLDSCWKLRMIPNGFVNIRSLQKLEIVKMPNLGKRVSRFTDDSGRESADFYKVRHVPSIIIR